jgi:flavin reductase (DIM6/NTAB) family NADH-FMN oxidoreductase RutF
MSKPFLPQESAMALGRLPSGLFILTAAHQDRETGMLVSWVQQCAFHPPLITAALKRGRDVLAWLEPGAAFTLNLIGEGQTNFLSHFGKGFALDQHAFHGLKVERHPGEAPILSDAAGYLLCRVQARHAAGDHELFVASVEGGRMLQADAQPMVHVRKSGLRY